MRTYRDSIIPHAATLFAAASRKPGAEVFINLYTGGKYGPAVEVYEDVDNAAEFGVDHPTIGRYFASIHVAADGSLSWLDLSDHAHALAQDDKVDEREESAYVRDLTEGAGRRVL